MKIKLIKINNFRSIKEVEIDGPLDDVWTFVGQNNAGKSSVMHAIRAFYGEYDVKVEDFCRADGSNKPIEITMEYKLSDDEFSQLPEQYKLPSNTLSVVKRYTRDSLKGESHGFTKDLTTGEIKEVEEEFFGAKNVAVGKLGTVIYIPAVKDLGEELKKTKSSLFSKLISRILTETLTDLPSWNNLIKNTEEFANDLKSPVKATGEFRSVTEIEENLSSRLSGWGLKSQISISAPSPEDIILSGAKLRLISNETGVEEDPMNLGSGAQRSIVNNLLLLWAEIESKKIKTDKKK
ncbi:MAG: putative ATP-dependent endonuclease of the family, partial [Patescibacteria group bacterium]|nr:putative ATP-dependent endonuclease of the family [Patescibacteria group bacterium]